MYLVILYDGRGASYGSPALDQTSAEALFDSSGPSGRFVKVELLFGDPIAGFTVVATKEA